LPRETYEEVTDGLKKAVNWIESVFEYLTEKYQAFPDHEVFKSTCIATIQNNGIIPGKKSTAPEHTLFSYIDDLIKRTESGKRTLKNGARYGHITIKGYTTTLNRLKSLATKQGKSDYSFEDIDLDFYNDLRDFLLNEKNLSDNSFGTVVKNLKLFMNEATEEGLHNNIKHKSKRFIKVQLTPDNVYLNVDQLTKLADHDFSNDPRLERVRDLFLVGCWTGLRFSDFSNIKPENINGDFIQIRPQKTKSPIAIPIHASVKAVMARYAGKTSNSLPPAISNVNMNLYIKDACKEAGLTEKVSLTKTKGGKEIIETESLYKWVSSHTCRRSFASNMYRMGVPTVAIMAVTGHKTERAFFSYIKLSPTEKAQIMMEVWNRQAMKAV